MMVKQKKDKILKVNNNIKKVKIMEEEWDYLIILDACRYDYFENIWKKYFKEELKGELTKKISVGSSTVEWRDNSFKEYYDDVIYISSNPYINSNMYVNGFLGTEHFNKVYDVWADYWDEKIGTVLPETVTNTAIDIIKSNKNKRFIIHYLQPHAPYLSLNATSKGFPPPDLKSGKVLCGVKEEEKISKLNEIINILSGIFKKIGVMGNNPGWKLREFFNMPPASPMDAIKREYGKEGLRKTYFDNLEIVIQQVLILLDHLSGRIVVTSDHGELLGEQGCYSHEPGSTNPYLVEIPWLEIYKGRREIIYRDVSEKARIKGKIKSLKSLGKV